MFRKLLRTVDFRAVTAAVSVGCIVTYQQTSTFTPVNPFRD